MLRRIFMLAWQGGEVLISSITAFWDSRFALLIRTFTQSLSGSGSDAEESSALLRKTRVYGLLYNVNSFVNIGRVSKLISYLVAAFAHSRATSFHRISGLIAAMAAVCQRLAEHNIVRISQLVSAKVAILFNFEKIRILLSSALYAADTVSLSIDKFTNLFRLGALSSVFPEILNATVHEVLNRSVQLCKASPTILSAAVSENLFTSAYAVSRLLIEQVIDIRLQFLRHAPLLTADTVTQSAILSVSIFSSRLLTRVRTLLFRASRFQNLSRITSLGSQISSLLQRISSILIQSTKILISTLTATFTYSYRQMILKRADLSRVQKELVNLLRHHEPQELLKASALFAADGKIAMEFHSVSVLRVSSLVAYIRAEIVYMYTIIIARTSVLLSAVSRLVEVNRHIFNTNAAGLSAPFSFQVPISLFIGTISTLLILLPTTVSAAVCSLFRTHVLAECSLSSPKSINSHEFGHDTSTANPNGAEAVEIITEAENATDSRAKMAFWIDPVLVDNVLYIRQAYACTYSDGVLEVK